MQAIEEYGDVLIHHRGKSGKAFQTAKSGDTNPEVIAGWFDGRHVTVVERLPVGSPLERLGVRERAVEVEQDAADHTSVHDLNVA